MLLIRGENGHAEHLQVDDAAYDRYLARHAHVPHLVAEPNNVMRARTWSWTRRLRLLDCSNGGKLPSPVSVAEDVHAALAHIGFDGLPGARRRLLRALGRPPLPHRPLADADFKYFTTLVAAFVPTGGRYSELAADVGAKLGVATATARRPPLAVAEASIRKYMPNRLEIRRHFSSAMPTAVAHALTPSAIGLVPQSSTPVLAGSPSSARRRRPRRSRSRPPT